MKKILTVLFSLLICVCLCGCGGGNQATSLDIKKAASALDAKMGNMYDLDEAELDVVYGLDTSLLKEYVAKSNSTANGNMYLLLNVDANNKNAVKEQVKHMFEVLENQSSLYSPDAVELIKNRLETSVGDYLIYIVGDDTTALYDIVKNCIN